MWLNYLGGWEYWNFTARKDTNLDVNERVISDVDVFSDMETFKTGQEDFKTNLILSSKIVTVNSQLLNEAQMASVSEILRSIKIIDVENNVSVKCLTDSVRIKRENQKLYSISFEIEYPRHYVQTQ
jgi:hypothetical protein